MTTIIEVYEVWRVEDRWNSDGVDFWDFATEEAANKYITALEEDGDEIKHILTLRKLSEQETILAALAFYKSSLTF